MESLLRKKITHSIKWNALEAIPYQMVLSLHTIALFRSVDSVTYGLIGTVFSTIFLVVGLVNLGFDAALPTFFLDACVSKQSFRRIVGLHCVPSWICMALVFAYVPYALSGKLLESCNVLLLLAIILLESGKKVVRAVLHTAFLNKQTALVELAQLLLYVVFVWGCYLAGAVLDTRLMMAGLFLSTLLATVILVYYLYIFYRELPDQQPPLYSLHNLYKHRFYAALLSLHRQLFSGNALVVMSAYSFGLPTAGGVKIISSIIHSVTLCIQKIFGSTTDALLAHVRYEKPDYKQHAFICISQQTHAALYSTVCFSLMSIALYYFYAGSQVATAASLSLVLIFVIQVLEQFFMSYDSFFIAESKSKELLMVYLFILAAVYSSVYFSVCKTPLSFLQLLVVARISSLVTLHALCYRWWNIRPRIYLNPLYLVCSLFASLACFLCLQ